MALAHMAGSWSPLSGLNTPGLHLRQARQHAGQVRGPGARQVLVLRGVVLHVEQARRLARAVDARAGARGIGEPNSASE